MAPEMRQRLGLHCDVVHQVEHGRGKLGAAVRWCVSSMPYRHVRMFNPNLARAIEEELRQEDYDVVLCNFLDMAQHCSRISREGARPL